MQKTPLFCSILTIYNEIRRKKIINMEKQELLLKMQGMFTHPNNMLWTDSTTEKFHTG
jgi:hypothetical protein